MATAPLRKSVLIVGAGLSGLVAARRLCQAGFRVTVLEARERVGGRMFSTTTVNGSVVDLGGQWGGASHHRFASLLDELGVGHYPSHYAGLGVFHWQGRRIEAPLAERFERSLLFFEPAALELPPNEISAMHQLQQAFAELVAQVNPQKPWLTPDAERLDRLTVAQWAALHSPVPLAQLPLEWLCRVGGSGGFEPWETSILHLAWTQSVSPQSEMPEAWLVRGSAGAVAQRLAEDLEAKAPGTVRLGLLAHSISQLQEEVMVEAEGECFRASTVIVAVPPPQRLAINFDPPLPPAHQALLQRSPMGAMIKILVVYERPFWRTRSFNGLGIGDLPALELTADSSPPEGHPAVLATFLAGERALRLGGLPAHLRREIVLDDLVAYWGAEAAAPLDFLEKDWNREPFTGGAFTSFQTPGSWTSFASLAADSCGGPSPAPHGRVFWAGTEVSPRWPGYFEGAIEAGELSANAIMSRCGVT